MKVILGNYKKYFGPYELARIICFWNEDKAFALGKKLSKSSIREFLDYIDSIRKRKEYVRIDPWDLYSMDDTLALIILPMLKNLRKDQEGAPFVDDEDLPESFHETIDKKSPEELDKHVFDRWDWVLNEIIFAFENKYDQTNRVQKGFELFGKYYQALWS